MPYSSSLTDQEWEIIKPLLPKKKITKPPTWTKREILDGIFYRPSGKAEGRGQR
ncbi:MAG: transposase [Brasilonema sp.]